MHTIGVEGQGPLASKIRTLGVRYPEYRKGQSLLNTPTSKVFEKTQICSMKVARVREVLVKVPRGEGPRRCNHRGMISL